MTLLLPAAVFVAVFGTVLLLTRRAPRPVARLERHAVVAGGAVVVAGPAPRTPLISKVSAGTAGAWGNKVARREVKSKAEKLLLESGSATPLGTYLLLRASFMLVLTPLLVLIILKGQGLSPMGLGMSGLALFVLPNLPSTRLKRKARKRAKQIELAMPDALDLLVVCVESGLSLDGGLSQVARRTAGTLADEFQRLQREIGAGMSRRDALQALAARSQSQSLGIFCTTIIQADKMGMSIGVTLRTLVETMRTRRRQAAETQARKAPLKMLPFLVFFMIPSLFIVILGPTALALRQFFQTMK